MVADKGPSYDGNPRLLKIGQYGSLFEISQHKVIDVEKVLGGAVEDRDLLEPLLNTAEHAAFTNQQNDTYRSARSEQIGDRPSALGNGDRWRIVLPMFVGMVRRP